MLVQQSFSPLSYGCDYIILKKVSKA